MRGVDLDAKMRTVERALGIEVTLAQLPYQRFVAFCPQVDKEFSEWFVKASRAEAALKALHEAVYQARGKVVYKSQMGLCCFCGRKMPSNSYEIDHVKMRSHGRDDSVSNLRACCTGLNGCDGHRRRHGG